MSDDANVRLRGLNHGWSYTIRFQGGHCHRSPLRFTEASEALIAGEHDAATYLAADRRLTQ